MVRSDRTINYQVRIHGYINRMEQIFFLFIKEFAVRYNIYETNMNSQVMRVCIFLSGLYYSA